MKQIETYFLEGEGPTLNSYFFGSVIKYHVFIFEKKFLKIAFFSELVDLKKTKQNQNKKIRTKVKYGKYGKPYSTANSNLVLIIVYVHSLKLKLARR